MRWGRPPRRPSPRPDGVCRGEKKSACQNAVTAIPAGHARRGGSAKGFGATTRAGCVRCRSRSDDASLQVPRGGGCCRQCSDARRMRPGRQRALDQRSYALKRTSRCHRRAEDTELRSGTDRSGTRWQVPPSPCAAIGSGHADSLQQGGGAAFADGFARPTFHPYAFRIGGSGFSDRESIVSFVAERHEAGDGWSATKLQPPTGQAGSPDEATYGLALRVSQPGELVRRGGAKLIVDCRSGLLVTWVGPGYGPDDVHARQT